MQRHLLLDIFSSPGFSSPFNFLLSATSSSLRCAGWLENGHCIQFITIHLSFLRLLSCSSMGAPLQDKPAAKWVLHQLWYFSNICSSMDSSWELFFSGKIHLLWYWHPWATAAPLSSSPWTRGDPLPLCLKHLHLLLHVWTWWAQHHFLCLLFSSPSPLCFLTFCLFKNVLPQTHHQLGWRAQLCSSWQVGPATPGYVQPLPSAQTGALPQTLF